MAGRNRFFDNEMFKTEQELMVEEIERQQALECEGELQLEHLDRLFELQGLLESGVTFNGGVRYTMEQQLGYVPESLELAQEGIVSTIWEGIKAFFKAIGKFISELFTGKSKSSTNKVDSYLSKLKEYEAKYGDIYKNRMKDWYPDNFKATSDKALKTFPEDSKIQRGVEQIKQQYDSERFAKACTHLSLMPTLPIYGRLSSIVVATLSTLPLHDVNAKILKDAQSQNFSGGNAVLYEPLTLKQSIPAPLYDSYVKLFKMAGEQLPELLGDVTESMLNGVLRTAHEKQKLDAYPAIFNRGSGTHSRDLMKDYQSWIDRTGKDLPKVKQEVDQMVSKINDSTDTKLASQIRQLGKDLNAQIVAVNFIHTLLDRMIEASSYLLEVEMKVIDISEYVQTQAVKAHP